MLSDRMGFFKGTNKDDGIELGLEGRIVSWGWIGLQEPLSESTLRSKLMKG